MVIHTFGDSHSYSGWTGVKIHHLGPKLCFSIGRDGITIHDCVHNGDTVIFCFGEIDCRCHVHKHVTDDRDYTKIIDTIVDNYFIQIQKAVSMFDSLQTCVYNVVPPVERRNTAENSEYPYLGTDEERKTYVIYFNKRLQQKCIEYGYLFIDVYTKYTDSNGFLNKQLSDGNVHIRNGVHLRQFITKNVFCSTLE
jgi:hypothetical protein